MATNYFKDGVKITTDFTHGEGDNAISIPWENLLVWDDDTLAAHGITKVVTPDVPSVISDRQFFQQLAIDNYINQEEALAAVMTGSIPAPLEGFINALPAEYQFNARMIMSGATEFHRNHDMVNMVAQYMDMTQEQVDQFFIKAAAL